MENPEFFGNEFQISLQEKCLDAWPALKENPKINFSGRNFGWDNPALDDIDAIADLVNTFGVISIFSISQAILQSFIENLNSRQLDVEIWHGSDPLPQLPAYVPLSLRM